MISRFVSLKKELRKSQIRRKLAPAEKIVANLDLVFHKVTVEKKAASKLAKCLELISENVIKLSNLAAVSSDNENKMGAFVRSITKLSTLGIGAKAAMKYEGLLHLENTILKQVVLLVTGEPDPREGFVWRGKERKSFLERYLDASSRVANQEKVKLLLDEVNPADCSFSMFSTTRFKDSAFVVAQLCTSQLYLVLNKVLQENLSSLNLNPTTNPLAHFVLHANKNIPLIFPLLHAFHTFTRFHTTPNFTFLGLKYPYPYLGRFMLERLTRNKVLQRLCSREIAKLSQLEVSQIVDWWGQSFAFPGEPETKKPSSEETVQETSDEDSSGDFSSDYSDERVSSEESSSETKILLCRFKTRQTRCKLPSLEDQYYCQEHLQFDDNFTLSGYRAPKPSSPSSDLFQRYGEFILNRVLEYEKIVTVSDLDLLREKIM